MGPGRAGLRVLGGEELAPVDPIDDAAARQPFGSHRGGEPNAPGGRHQPGVRESGHRCCLHRPGGRASIDLDRAIAGRA